MPNLTGVLKFKTLYNNSATEVFKQTQSDSGVTPLGGDKDYNITVYFNANRVSTIYGNYTRVRPASSNTLYIIKY